MTSFHQIVTLLLFFQFMANLEQSEIRIPDEWFLKLTFSSIESFYRKKTENTTKKSPTQLSHY